MAFERLNENEWKILEKLVRSGKSLRGRPPKQHRQIFEAVFWIASYDVPSERFGKWNTVYRQFKRWSEADLWNRVLDELENHSEMAEQSRSLKHNILATIRLARQRQMQRSSVTGTGSSAARHSLAPGKSLEADPVNL